MFSVRAPRRQPGYDDFFERSVDDAGYLWAQRTRAVNRADYCESDISDIDGRLRANLKVLSLAPEKAWPLVSDLYAIGDAGGMFAASVLAFSTADARRIEDILADVYKLPELRPGLISALGWLSGSLVHPWIKKFLLSSDNQCRLIAVAACSARREDPREFLTKLVEHPTCLTDNALGARICRLIGEVKRHDLSALLRDMQQHGDETAMFWAHWSSLLLGDMAAIEGIQKFVLQVSDCQDRAIDMAFRCLPLAQGRNWISLLAKDDRQRRQVIRATGILGDMEAVPWLIAQMFEEPLSRVAGEAFSSLTGVDLHKAGLSQETPLQDETEEVVDDDDSLPWPNTALVHDYWSKANQSVHKKIKYLFGKEITDGHLRQIYSIGNQRQRRSAALEFALRNREQILLNCAARV